MHWRAALCVLGISWLQSCDQEPLGQKKPNVDDGPLSGSTWVAADEMLELTLFVEGDLRSPNGTRILTGTVSSNRPECFLPSPLTATLHETGFDSLNQSHGEGVDLVFLQMHGQLEQAALRAQVTLSVHAQDCDIQERIARKCQVINAPMVFERRWPGTPRSPAQGEPDA